MIYFDNAATSLHKPQEVGRAIVQALNTLGGSGRGVHSPALAAGMTLLEAREKLAQFFNASSPAAVAFAPNATAALNTAIAGLLCAGDHAITTAVSHNSALRPLYREQKRGVELSILSVMPDASISYEAFDALFCSQTKLAVLTHASNVTGDIYDIARMADICHAHGALCIVDAAQTAGFLSLDMQKLGVDVLVFTGHKGLLGPQGTGGMCVAEGVEIEPLIVGGSGTHSFDKEHPPFMPERLEAGTQNAHAIAGLSAGLDYLNSVGLETYASHIRKLTVRFEESVHRLEGVRILGGNGGIDRTGIVALNVGSVDSALVSELLSTRYNICTRPGAHCAPLMHTALGTAEQGVVRFSFSGFNTKDEIDTAIEALGEIAAELLSDTQNASVKIES